MYKIDIIILLVLSIWLNLSLYTWSLGSLSKFYDNDIVRDLVLLRILLLRSLSWQWRIATTVVVIPFAARLF